MIETTEAIVLNSKKFGDSSKIISLFTKDSGRLSVLAKGAFQTKSKFGSALETLNYSSVTFYRKPGKDLHLLSAAELIKPMTKISDSYEHLSVGLLIMETISQSFEQNEPNSDLFNFLIGALTFLNQLPNNPFPIFVYSQLYLAGLLGFAINFDEDFDENQLRSNNNLVFSIEEGAIVLQDKMKRTTSFRFNISALRSISKISSVPLDTVCTVPISEKDKRELLDFFVRFFSFHLEKKFNYKTFSLLNLNY
jgi:DNA repair protein RecO (recombination protein O)